MTDVLTRPAPPPDRTVPYGPRPEHVIDLRFPRGRPGDFPRGRRGGGPEHAPPLVVLIHGGFWRPAFDRAHLGPMADALAAAGYLVAVPEYRRAGMTPGWTGPFDDIAMAVDHVATIAAEYGADPGRTVWAGHSAGGHLALWAAARPGLPAGSPWRGPFAATRVVSLAGCNSLRLCAEWDLGKGAARNLMGGLPGEVPERYAVADPAALPGPRVPVWLVHGTADDRVPVAMSRLTSRGQLTEISGAGHFELIDPLSAAWPQVLTALDPGPPER